MLLAGWKGGVGFFWVNLTCTSKSLQSCGAKNTPSYFYFHAHYIIMTTNTHTVSRYFINTTTHIQYTKQKPTRIHYKKRSGSRTLKSGEHGEDLLFSFSDSWLYWRVVHVSSVLFCFLLFCVVLFLCCYAWMHFTWFFLCSSTRRIVTFNSMGSTSATRNSEWEKNRFNKKYQGAN